MEDHREVIIGNANLFTLGEENRHIPDGAMLVRGGIIKKIGTTPEIQEAHPHADFIDMMGLVTLPGNIISHTHLYSSFARGMGLKDEAPSNFVEILQRLWWRLDKVLEPEDIYYSALVYLIQCIQYGTTAFIDHHASPGFIDGSLDIIARAVLESGLRGSLCYEITDRGGEQEAAAGIRENIRFLKKCREYPNSYLRGALGFHASFTVSDNTWQEALGQAEGLNPVVHIHVEEAESDRIHSEETYGMPVLERMEKLGATKFPVMACHCVHITDREIQVIKNNNITVIHNPQSNMNNAVGVAPVLGMMEEGITVALGTDGMTADYFQEMKVLPLLHKVKSGDPRTFSFPQLYEMIFQNGSKVAGLFWQDHPMGYIKEGCYADIIGLDYIPPTPMNADNILGHVLFGINSSMVDTTIVNGQVLMTGRNLLHLDQERIMARSRELAAKVWERF